APHGARSSAPRCGCGFDLRFRCFCCTTLHGVAWRCRFDRLRTRDLRARDVKPRACDSTELVEVNPAALRPLCAFDLVCAAVHDAPERSSAAPAPPRPERS